MPKNMSDRAKVKVSDKKTGTKNADNRIADKSFTYSQAGVDIDKAAKTITGLKNTIHSTFTKNVLSDLSAFSALYELDLKEIKNPVLVSTTDGVGTKLIIAKELNNYKTIGQDLVAMCLNDLICSGAKPLFFLDYIACGHIDSRKIADIIRSISESCLACRTSLVGGETAEMPDMYDEDEIDLAGFAVGVVDRLKIIKKEMVCEGDAIVGIASSGVHSNGFSLVRKIINERGFKLKERYDWSGGKTLGEVLLVPTKLYYRLINSLIYDKNIRINGIANITGGGFYDNINRIIPENFDVVINEGTWPVPEIFNFLQTAGNVDKEEMFKVFNMGIGMVVIVPAADYEQISKIAAGLGEKVFKIGKIEKGSGKVTIK